jgi:hypothetical protein
VRETEREIEREIETESEGDVPLKKPFIGSHASPEEKMKMKGEDESEHDCDDDRHKTKKREKSEIDLLTNIILDPVRDVKDQVREEGGEEREGDSTKT